jgi:hypothetical protein
MTRKRKKSKSPERKRRTGKQKTLPRNRTERKGGAAAPSLCIGRATPAGAFDRAEQKSRGRA